MARAVFRGYDRKALDAEYNNREKVAAAAPWLARYTTASADLEPIRLCYLNEILALTPEAASLHSPVNLVPSRPGPLLLAVGGLEGPPSRRRGGAAACPARRWTRRTA